MRKETVMNRFGRTITSSRLNRRALLRRGGVAGAGLAAARYAPGIWTPGASAATNLSVLSPLAPDPAPPGVAEFSMDDFAAWQEANDATVAYEAIAWPQLHDKMATNFASGTHVHDLYYMSGWVPEFAQFLTPLQDALPQDLVDDLPPSSFSTVTWDGDTLGVVFTLSLLTLFYNTEHLEQAGLDGPPTTWDELKGYAQELTGDNRYGWVLNYGQADGIGGVASYWMVFLQQAGGTMYGDDGMPVFNDAPGLDALKLMVDMYTNGSTDPGAISYIGINDATNVFTAGNASMMMNWPFMWKPASDPETSQIVDQLGSAILPAGAAGTASIDGTDAWTVANTSANPELAMELIWFYLDPVVQLRQVLDTGWLPIRLSVLGDPAVQEGAPNAAIVLEQAQHPYDSFVTPDYTAVTLAIGTEIQRAMQGAKTPEEALQDASDQVTEIVSQRET
jgi:ABC-type glycerol-3-phosphate transport system substrate-binding protein